MQLRATRLTAIASAVKRVIKAFSPASLFTSGAPGVWYDPSDVKLDWRYNLLTRSEEFDNAAWVKLQTTVTANLTIAPNGALTADTLTDNGTLSSHSIYQAYTTAASGVHTGTVSVKQGTARYVVVSLATGSAGSVRYSAVVDLQAGAIIQNNSLNSPVSPSASISAEENGYHKVSVSLTSSATTGYLIVAMSNTGTPSVFESGTLDPRYAGSGQTIQLWGASLTTAADAAKPYQRITDGVVDYFAAHPQPVMFQDSAGTVPVTAVEQPVGLMLDKSQGLVLGPKIVDDNFNSGTSGWISYTNTAETSAVSTANGNLVVTTQRSDGSSGAKKPLTGLTAGKWYKATARIKKTTDPSANLATANLRFVNGDATVGWVASFSATSTSFVAATIYFSPTGTTGTLGLVSGGTAATTSTYVMEYDDVVVQELAGNHAFQSTSASRPVLSARYNLLTKTEQFDDAAWLKNAVTVAANAETAPDGTLTSDKLIATSATAFHSLQFPLGTIPNSTNCVVSISAKKAEYSQMYVGNGFGTRQARFDLNAGTVVSVTADTVATITPEANGFYRCAITFISTVNNTPQFTVDNGTGGQFAGNGTSGIYIWGASLVPANQSTLPYQRVNTSTDYNTTGFLPYLKFDGVDDSLSTNSISFTSTDKMSVFAGVRKLSDAATAIIAELSSDWFNNDGSFDLVSRPNAANYGWNSRGSLSVVVSSTNIFSAPVTSVLTGQSVINTDTLNLRVNGTQVATSTADQGTGNYGNYPLYIGRRNNATLPFNGQLYSMIIVGKAVTAGELSSTETYVNQKTGAY